jgi:hypothetical protein
MDKIEGRKYGLRLPDLLRIAAQSRHKIGKAVTNPAARSEVGMENL